MQAPHLMHLVLSTTWGFFRLPEMAPTGQILAHRVQPRHLAPSMTMEMCIRDRDYTTFVEMLEEGQVGQVEVQQQENLVLFTSTDGKTIYQAGMLPDSGLTPVSYTHLCCALRQNTGRTEWSW